MTSGISILYKKNEFVIRQWLNPLYLVTCVHLLFAYVVVSIIIFTLERFNAEAVRLQRLCVNWLNSNNKDDSADGQMQTLLSFMYLGKRAAGGT